MKFVRFVQRHIIPFWRMYIVILTPLVLLPFPILVHGTEARAAYGVLLMTIYWLTSAIPLAITSLLPIVVFPLMDVLSTSEVCALYFKEPNVVFLGGVVLALGVEKSGLHRRIALKVILTIGTNPQWLMLGFMMVGVLLSLWISNSGVTAMLIPIVHAVVDEIFLDSEKDNLEKDYNAIPLIVLNEKEDSLDSENLPNKIKEKVRMTLMLSISYASSFGGAGTLIGSGAPLAFKGILEELYGLETGLSFASFMAVGVPVALLNMLLTWIWLYFLLMDCCKGNMDFKQEIRNNKEIKRSITHQYRQLGPITFYEKSIMFLFSLLIVLWVFKDPQFMPGWEDIFPHEHRIGDGTVAILVVILAFILPATPNFWWFNRSNEAKEPSSSESLLDWAYVQNRFPWGVILLLGGGYAISDAFKVSGLSYWIGHHLSVLAVLPHIVTMFLMCILASILTEVASNTATASILLPIVAQMGEATGINPLYLMIPVTISCTYAFMLPMGTPCNAMVLASAKIRPRDMIKAGFLTKILTILSLCLVMETIGELLFDLHASHLPFWADGARPTRTLSNN